MGQATVHWYGDAEDASTRFGELSADGTARAEALLGTDLAAPIDIFGYAGRDEFFGALGPGAREWTGAAAYPDLRTVFMWLGGGDQAYLETAIVHEVTHVVFHDATDNPFHEPAQWLNESLATWAETRAAPPLLAAWSTAPVSAAGTAAALAACCVSNTPSAAEVNVSPRLVSRLRSKSRPRDSLPATSPRVQPSCAAAWSLVFPSR